MKPKRKPRWYHLLSKATQFLCPGHPASYNGVACGSSRPRKRRK